VFLLHAGMGLPPINLKYKSVLEELERLFIRHCFIWDTVDYIRKVGAHEERFLRERV